MALTAFAPLLALLLDKIFGEPQRWHPLIVFGNSATRVEKQLYGADELSFVKRQWRGFVAALVLLLPVTVVAWFLSSLPVVGDFFSIIILYGCLGLQSLHEHARAISKPLLAGDLTAARRTIAMIVSRDTDAMDETQITRATVESVLENGNDAVFATLFWFFVFGAPGAVLLRAANTLDAMWGYKTERYLHFGRFAARFDDVLNWLPARLTALSFALLGKTQCALHCWYTQASQCESPNGGAVMTAGAGALQITLGGAASYHGSVKQKIIMGEGKTPTAFDIEHALRLVRYSAWAWVSLYTIFYFFYA